MRKLALFVLFFALPVGAAAQTSKYGIPASGMTAAVDAVGLPVSTIAKLPVCDVSHLGALRAVVDANSPTFGGTLTGGSTTKTIAFCNGTAWVAH